MSNPKVQFILPVFGMRSELPWSDPLRVVRAGHAVEVTPQLAHGAPALLGALKNLVQFYCGDKDMNAPQWAKAKAVITFVEGQS